MRVGFSKDIHRLVTNRPLIICGVTIPFDMGEEAHSDGDVCYHAIMESILGALAKGDLGKHFPTNDDRYKNISSSILMDEVYKILKKEGYHINNLDVFISLEKPKLAPYIEEMRKNTASLLRTSIDNISIKAGTNEKCGEVGLSKAIEAYSIVSVEKD